jgi:hypothetical protein
MRSYRGGLMLQPEDIARAVVERAPGFAADALCDWSI